MAVASDKSVKFLKNLCHERVADPEHVAQVLGALEAGEMSQSLASAEISDFLKFPKKQGAPKKKFVEAAPGLYTDGTDIFEVKASKRGYFYAQKMIVTGTEVNKIRTKWTFVQGAMKDFQKWEPLSIEQAKEFGHKYGACVVCGRTLTNPESVEAGIGPICANKF